MTEAKWRSALVARLASWLAAVPVFSAAPGTGLVDITLPDRTPTRVERAWWPEDLEEQLIRLLPGDALETAARTLIDRTVEVRLDRDRAFLQVRIPLG